MQNIKGNGTRTVSTANKPTIVATDVFFLGSIGGVTLLDLASPIDSLFLPKPVTSRPHIVPSPTFAPFAFFRGNE
jgi:hypothetical protein